MSQIAIIVFIFGLLWGSFLSVVLTRLDDPRSIVFSRSKCPKCHKTLSAVSLVPILGYLLQRGKCASCKKPISLIYPALEVSTALIVVLIYLQYSLNLSSVLLFISFSAIIIACMQDIIEKEVDLSVLLVAIVFALGFSLSKSFQNPALLDLLLGLTFAAIIPFSLYLISKEKWMGLGDTLFALWAGGVLGFPLSIIGIFFGFLSGAIFAIIEKITGRNKKGVVAFGPFIVVGSLTAMIFGQKIVDWYLKLLGY